MFIPELRSLAHYAGCAVATDTAARIITIQGKSITLSLTFDEVEQLTCSKASALCTEANGMSSADNGGSK
jgi:hypothetical protein